jgi:hypothetical protein
MMHLPRQLHPYIPRHKMPQIAEGDIPEMLAWLGMKGVKFTAGEIAPYVPLYHQDIDPVKAMAVPDRVLSIPSLVSEEWGIIDGNHRAFKRYTLGSSVPYIRLNLPFQIALSQIKRFAKVSYAHP